MATYDVVIVGGGVTGTALLYALSRYSNVKRILLIERRHTVALVNSNTVNNSQTLHNGGIETNFSLAKALDVQDAARLLSGYVDRFAPEVGLKIQKMVIGVGPKEVDFLTRRYAAFKPHFPDMLRIGPATIAEVEPRVMEGRREDEAITALYTPTGHAVDYHRLSESFLERSRQQGKQVDTMFNSGVAKITQRGKGFVVRTTEGEEIQAKTMVVAAGPASLLFAHSLGYGREFGILPVTGSFYRARDVLQGKVYTVQNEKIPFAAVHGDPAVYDAHETRFGPTAMVLPLLERHHYKTFFEFMRSGLIGVHGIWSAARIMMDPTFFAFAVKNAVYDLPFIGKRSFLRAVRKIAPSLDAHELRLDAGAGGVRGQMINVRTHELARGSDKIVGHNIIFNMAPSPGASYCLKNAQNDAQSVALSLGSAGSFDLAGFRAELLGEIAEREEAIDERRPA